MERRSFLRNILTTSVAGSVALGQRSATPSVTVDSGNLAGSLPHNNDPGELRGEMLYRKLGRTGETVSAIGLGGSHVAKATLTDTESISLIHSAIDRGITFMDNSWDYNEGRSERNMGQALSEGGYRNKVFLMTKIDGRTKEIAARQIEDSLTRLKTDHIDLLQHHEVLRFDDPDRIFGEGGSMEAVLAAKKAGKIRFIGFTGHKDPHVHLCMLETAAKHGFQFDTVQMPLNVMDAHFRSFAQLVVPKLVEQQIGVLGMKPFCGGDGIALKSKTVEPIECLHYALNLPTSVVITGIDKPQILDQAIQAAKTFKPMDAQQLSALLSKTQQVAMNGEYELFKTSSHFDTTARHPDWLGSDSPAVQKIAPQLPS
ncbi:MAG: aldo/keto reductase [Acidobacteriota bacterium]|nr:aldo/keto reductase [Acidobacteriota bacterium]